MQIKDITISDVRNGKNWRVLNPKAMGKKGVALEDLEVEPLGQYSGGEVVYSGIFVYFERAAHRRGWLSELFGRRKGPKKSPYPPDRPKDLDPDASVIVKPLLMVKSIESQCWDYLENVGDQWRQMGLRPDPNAPHGNEYFANPLDEDPWFDVCDDEGTIRKLHKRGFREWIGYMEG